VTAAKIIKIIVNNYVGYVSVQFGTAQTVNYLTYQLPYFLISPTYINITITAPGYVPAIYGINSSQITSFETFVNITMVAHSNIMFQLIDQNNYPIYKNVTTTI